MVACYCRVSHEEQVKYGYSIQAQKDALIKYCNDKHLKYDLYVDEGISASSMKKRKQLLLMLDRCKNYDTILFTKLDRLSRNVLDANNINTILLSNKCTMKAIDEDDVDTSTADGKFLFNLKVSLAQREIEKTSERIKFVFNSKREKGLITSGVKKFGYDIKEQKYVVNKKEAQIIIDLFNYFLKTNGSMQETYKYFCKVIPKKSYDTFQTYMRNEEWIGKYKLYRKNEYVENYIPRIMDDELFNQVQNLIIKKPIHSDRSRIDGMFTNLLFCDECNHRFTKAVDYRTKVPVIRYVCDNAYRYKNGTTENKCSNRYSIRESVIEEYLIENLKNLASNYVVKNTIKIKAIDNSSRIKSLENKIAKLKDLYLDDLIDKDTYKKDYENYKNEIEKLKIVDVQKDLSSVKKLLELDIVHLYENLTSEEKRFFWCSIIDSIYINDKKIERVEFL